VKLVTISCDFNHMELNNRVSTSYA